MFIYEIPTLTGIRKVKEKEIVEGHQYHAHDTGKAYIESDNQTRPDEEKSPTIRNIYPVDNIGIGKEGKEIGEGLCAN